MNNKKLENNNQDPRLMEIYNNLDKLVIGLDDTFHFHCDQCGKCCINREDILMSPRDMYNAAKELGMSVKEFFEQYCETYIGSSSRIPLVRLVPKGSIKRCRLLKDRKCSIHNAKPTVCAMFPLGRCIQMEADKLGTELSAGQIQYIFMDPGCGDKSETHTVREWLESFGFPIEDVFFLKWQQTVAEVGDILQRAEKRADAKTMELIWNVVFIGCYLNYKVDEDFIPQFEKNIQDILALVQQLPVKKEGK